MQEEIVSGKKFRRLIDAATDKWQRISFWSKASDCVMEDENGNETTVENEIQDIKNNIETINSDLKKQVLIYNKDTDYYQGYVEKKLDEESTGEGEWKDIVYAGLKCDGYLIKDGKFLYKPHLGGHLVAHPGLPAAFYDLNPKIQYTPNYPLNVKQTLEYFCLEINPKNQKSGGSLFSLFPINMDNYTHMILDYQLISPPNCSAVIGFTNSPFCDHYNTIGIPTFLSNDQIRNKVTIDLKYEEGYKHLAIALYGLKPSTLLTNISMCIYNIKFLKQ